MQHTFKHSNTGTFLELRFLISMKAWTIFLHHLCAFMLTLHTSQVPSETSTKTDRNTSKSQSQYNQQINTTGFLEGMGTTNKAEYILTLYIAKATWVTICVACASLKHVLLQ